MCLKRKRLTVFEDWKLEEIVWIVVIKLIWSENCYVGKVAVGRKSWCLFSVLIRFKIELTAAKTTHFANLRTLRVVHGARMVRVRVVVRQTHLLGKTDFENATTTSLVEPITRSPC